MRAIDLLNTEYDFVIIGSGFGGSVSALRLSEKGYKVLVIEKRALVSTGGFPQNQLADESLAVGACTQVDGHHAFEFFSSFEHLVRLGRGRWFAGVCVHAADSQTGVF